MPRPGNRSRSTSPYETAYKELAKLGLVRKTPSSEDLPNTTVMGNVEADSAASLAFHIRNQLDGFPPEVLALTKLLVVGVKVENSMGRYAI